MSGEVGETDDFGLLLCVSELIVPDLLRTYRALANLFPRELSTWNIGGDNIALGIKSHDLHTDGACSTGFNFMFVTEEVDSSFATTIVKSTLDQNAKHGTLSGVDCY